MTIDVSTNSQNWLGNGATTVFPYTFAMPDASDATLLLTDSAGVQTTIPGGSYSITGVGQPTAGGGPQGGNVTYPLSGSPVPAGSSLTLIRDVPYTQPDQFTNQGGLWPLVIEGSEDNLEMQIQQLANGLSRAILINPADTSPPVPLAPAAARAGKYLAFNSLGQPIAALSAPGTTPVSAAMAPVVAAATIAAAQALLSITPVSLAMAPVVGAASIAAATQLLQVWSNIGLAKTTTYPVANADHAKTITLGGNASYSFTAGAASGFDSNFFVRVVNTDASNSKLIVIAGYASFRLWPKQSMLLYAQNNVWYYDKPNRWVPGSGAGPIIYVNSATGSASNDGLSAASPLATIGAGINMANGEIDWTGNNTVTIQLGVGSSGSPITYAETILYSQNLVGANELNILGDPLHPNFAIWQPSGGTYCFQARDGGIASVTGLTVQGAASGDIGFIASQFGVLDLTSVHFGSFTGGVPIQLNSGGRINWVVGNCTIGGTAFEDFLQCLDSGSTISILGLGVSVAVTNALTFTNFIQTVSNSGATVTGGLTFTGTGSGAGSTGTKYSVTYNSVFNKNGVTFPGATGGSSSTGGQVL